MSSDYIINKYNKYTTKYLNALDDSKKIIYLNKINYYKNQMGGIMGPRSGVSEQINKLQLQQKQQINIIISYLRYKYYRLLTYIFHRHQYRTKYFEPTKFREIIQLELNNGIQKYEASKQVLITHIKKTKTISFASFLTDVTNSDIIKSLSEKYNITKSEIIDGVQFNEAYQKAKIANTVQYDQIKQERKAEYTKINTYQETEQQKIHDIIKTKTPSDAIKAIDHMYKHYLTFVNTQLIQNPTNLVSNIMKSQVGIMLEPIPLPSNDPDNGYITINEEEEKPLSPPINRYEYYPGRRPSPP